MNNISNALNSTPRLFVDYTCIIIHQFNQAALTKETNRELANVHTWTQANKITASPQKLSLVIPPKTTQYLQCRNKLQQFNYSFTKLCEIP